MPVLPSVASPHLNGGKTKFSVNVGATNRVMLDVFVAAFGETIVTEPSAFRVTDVGATPVYVYPVVTGIAPIARGTPPVVQ